MQLFKIGPGEVRWQFDNGVVVHVRNDDGGYASVVCWDTVTDYGWNPLAQFCVDHLPYQEQTLSACELAEFLFKMAKYPERIAV